MHTLLEEKKHGFEHRWGVCCRGKGTRLRTQEGCLLLGNIADHGHYRREAITGYALGVVGACSGPSGPPPVARVAPDRCPCTVPLSTGRRVLHLAREGPTARFRHDGGTYWK